MKQRRARTHTHTEPVKDVKGTARDSVFLSDCFHDGVSRCSVLFLVHGQMSGNYFGLLQLTLKVF